MDLETVQIMKGLYSNLIRESEQLRILKKYINSDKTLCKEEIKTLIEAMEEEE